MCVCSCLRCALMNHHFTLARFSVGYIIYTPLIAQQNTNTRTHVIALNSTRHIYDTLSATVFLPIEWSSHPLSSMLGTPTSARPRFQDRNHDTRDHFSPDTSALQLCNTLAGGGMCKRHLLSNIDVLFPLNRSHTIACVCMCVDDMERFLLLFSV